MIIPFYVDIPNNSFLFIYFFVELKTKLKNNYFKSFIK